MTARRWTEQDLMRARREAKADTSRAPVRPPAETEAEFQKAVIDFARMHRWRAVHFRPARTADGWRTPVTADGEGFLDLILVRGRVIFAELKSDSGTVSDAQAEWIAALHDAGQEAYVFRPSDWDVLTKILGAKG